MTIKSIAFALALMPVLAFASSIELLADKAIAEAQTLQASQLSLMPQLLLAPAKEIPTNSESSAPRKAKTSKADKKKALADAAEYLKKVKAQEAEEAKNKEIANSKREKAAKLLAQGKAKRLNMALEQAKAKADEILSQNSHLASIWDSIERLEAENPNHDYSRHFKIEMQLEDLWIALFDAATAEESVILEHYQAFRDESQGLTLDTQSPPTEA